MRGCWPPAAGPPAAGRRLLARRLLAAGGPPVLGPAGLGSACGWIRNPRLQRRVLPGTVGRERRGGRRGGEEERAATRAFLLPWCPRASCKGFDERALLVAGLQTRNSRRGRRAMAPGARLSIFWSLIFPDPPHTRRLFRRFPSGLASVRRSHLGGGGGGGRDPATMRRLLRARRLQPRGGVALAADQRLHRRRERGRTWRARALDRHGGRRAFDPGQELVLEARARPARGGARRRRRWPRPRLLGGAT